MIKLINYFENKIKIEEFFLLFLTLLVKFSHGSAHFLQGTCKISSAWELLESCGGAPQLAGSACLYLEYLLES